MNSQEKDIELVPGIKPGKVLEIPRNEASELELHHQITEWRNAQRRAAQKRIKVPKPLKSETTKFCFPLTKQEQKKLDQVLAENNKLPNWHGHKPLRA